MNEEFIKDADACYRLAEQKASRYFQSLYMQVMQKDYVPVLIKDMQLWKNNHIHHSLLSFFSRRGKNDSGDYRSYIKWLDRTGRLDSYLNRSISYIYMRDLGKSLSSADTQERVRSAVESLKSYLTRLSKKGKNDDNWTINIAKLYREAQKEGIESTVTWLMNKFKTVSDNIPEAMDAVHARRKLIKIIGGVLMHQVEDMRDRSSPEERKKKLDEAIRLGYCYGLTYPFIDDLLDAKILSVKEKKQYSDLIRTTLITGSVPELGEWDGENIELIRYIHSELRDAFNYIKSRHKTDIRQSFFEQSYIFFNSQENDRIKDLSYDGYSNEVLYIPVIIKSASSRLIARSVIGAPEDEGFDNRTFYYGIYNQLADDFADMFDDMEEGRVTPYTYYMKYHEKRPDLINPFELYWAVICNLIHNVYRSDDSTREVILSRAINGLKRFKERMGIQRYNEVLGPFASKNTEFNGFIQNLVQKADDVDFFDKLIRDNMITVLKDEQEEREEFEDTVETVRSQINNILSVSEAVNASIMKVPVVDAANYSLSGDGKRLRPITAYFMGVNEYGLNEAAIAPLLKSLEYLHTASLIFDDLPSQDNASSRRGRPTLHQIYDIATAELTGLFLTQKAVEEQASLSRFGSGNVLKLISYSAQAVQNTCMGQSMDLKSKGKPLTTEQLNMICFYKTGIAFEASIIMPTILADVKESEIDALKSYAHHAGIAFQIKDDLLDVEGDPGLMGKPTGKDVENNNSTFVSVLGREGAEKEMWEHYCLAMEALQEVPLKRLSQNEYI